jgi:hypothetical protein
MAHRRHCDQAQLYLRAPPAGCGVRSPPAICRIADTTTERTSLSSFLAPESQPRHAHAPLARLTASSRPSQSERTAQIETPPWSPTLPAPGDRPLKRGMDAPDAYEEQSSVSARTSHRVSADGCGSGCWFESSASRRATARRPVMTVSLHMNAQSRRQGGRRPTAKPLTLPASPAVPSSAAGWLSCEVCSRDLSNRRHDKRVVPPRA